MLFKIKILFYYLKYHYFVRFKTEAELESYQNEKINNHLRNIKNKSSYYRFYINQYASWRNFPLINKELFMANFNTINTVCITKENAFDIAVKAENSRSFSPTINNITVGLSSGTSGNRGIFLISKNERAKWVAAVLDKVLTFKLKKRKIAFFLRANSNLYESVKSSLLQFHFFDLLNDAEKNFEQLFKIKPDILVAQPSMLLLIANAIENHKIKIKFEKIISVAEVLEENDKKYLTEIFEQTIHQVYQCTEGFLASTCSFGTLHFHEDYIKIEKKYIDKEHQRYHPIITDFSRFTQPIIRYELNDIIIEPQIKCPCGSIYTAIGSIEGRSDDMFYFLNEERKLISIFPDFIRRAIILASEKIRGYIAEQISLDEINIYINTYEDNAVENIKSNLNELLTNNNIHKIKFNFSLEFPKLNSQKLRRIKRAATFKIPT